MTARDRAGYVEGLRQLADLLDQHPDLPLPSHGDISWLLFGEPDIDQKTTAALIVRLVPGTWRKTPYGDNGEKTLYGLETELAGRLGVTVYRNAVCERVVTGVEEVTRQVPDPSVQVPMVEVAEKVERVEWRCAPLLAADRTIAAEFDR